MRTALLLAVAALWLAGCDPPPQSKPLDESGNDTAAASDQPPDKEAALEGAQKYAPMAKAKRVEGKVLDQKDQQDAQIDQQSH
jgi:hypothetical protein